MKRRKTADKAAATVDEGLAYFTKDQIGEKRALTQDGFLLCRDVPIARAGMMLYGEGESPIDVGADGLARVSRTAADLLTPEAIASFNGKPVTLGHPPEREVTPATAKQYQVGTTLSPRAGEGEFKDCIVADLLITDKAAAAAVNHPDPQQQTRQVSAGYEAEYEQDEPGVGRQFDIRGNHVALVKRGRCGPRCAINDHATPKEPDMARVKTNDRQAPARARVALLPGVIKRLFADADEGAILEAMGLGQDGGDDDNPADLGEDGRGGDTHLHVHIGSDGKVTSPQVPVDDDADPAAADPAAAAAADPAANKGDINQRVANLETAVQTIGDQVAQVLAMMQGGGGDGDADADADGDPTTTEDDANDPSMVGSEDGEDDPAKVTDAAAAKKGKGKVGDSAALQDSFQATLSGCEILWPGFKMPVFDAKLPRGKTIDAMCAARRKALGMFYSTAEGQRVVNSAHGVANDSEVDLDALQCPALARLFQATVGVQRTLNTRKVTDSAKATPVGNFKQLGKTADKEVVKGPTTIAELNAHFAKQYGRSA